MTVKNIMFSGVMAAILMAGANAHAAVEIASTGYVDTALKTKADASDLTALQGVVENADTGLATKASKTELTNGLALKANVADVYTKTEADSLLATKADVNNVLAKSESYTAAQVDAKISETIASLESGGSIELGGYAKTQDVNDALALKADKTAVQAITASLEDYAKTTDVESKDAATLASAKGYTDTAIAGLSGENGALTTLAAGVAANEEAIALKADKTTVEGIQTTINQLGGTYATDAELAAEKSALTAAIDAKVATETYNTKVGELETAIGNKQATLTEPQLAAVNSGVTSGTVAQVDANKTAISSLSNDLATKITKPTACDTGNCVLAMMGGGDPEWIVLTLPTEE